MGTRFGTVGGAQQTIAFVWTGSATGVHWGEKPRAVDFFDAAGIVGNLALAHDVSVGFARPEAVPPFLTSGKAASLLPRPRTIAPETPHGAGGPLGVVGELSGSVADAFGLPAGVPVYVAELDWDLLARFEQRTRTVSAVPRFPPVVRDISILIDDRIAAETIRTTIGDTAGALLEDVREFDRYQGKGIPDEHVSLSLRLTFRSAERTLTDGEVQNAMDAVLAALRDRHAAIQR